MESEGVTKLKLAHFFISGRLLNKELDKDLVLRDGRPRVFYTLINPHSRKDLRVGGWHSKGNKQLVCNLFVMTKLYYTGDPNRTKEDGLTLIEFVLKMNQQQVGMQDPCYNFIEFIVGN
jgi:hypothetical protein